MNHKVLCLSFIGILLLTGSCSKRKTTGSINQGGLIMVSPKETKVTHADENYHVDLDWNPEEFGRDFRKALPNWDLNARQKRKISSNLEKYIQDLNNSGNLPSIHTVLDIHERFDATMNEMMFDGQFVSYMNEIRSKFPRTTKESWKNLDEIQYLKTKSVGKRQPQSRIAYLNENLDLTVDQSDEIEFIMDEYFHAILQRVRPGSSNRAENLRITENLLKKEEAEIRDVLTSKQQSAYLTLPDYDEYYATATQDVTTVSSIQENAKYEEEKRQRIVESQPVPPTGSLKSTTSQNTISAPTIPEPPAAEPTTSEPIVLEPPVSESTATKPTIPEPIDQILPGKMSPPQKTKPTSPVAKKIPVEPTTSQRIVQETMPKPDPQIEDPNQSSGVVGGLKYNEIVKQKEEQKLVLPQAPQNKVSESTSGPTNQISRRIQMKSEIEESAEENLIWEYSKLNLNEQQIVEMRKFRNEIAVERTEIMVEHMYDHKLLMGELAELKKKEANRIQQLLTKEQWAVFTSNQKLNPSDNTADKAKQKKRSKKKKSVFSKKMGRNSW